MRLFLLFVAVVVLVGCSSHLEVTAADIPDELDETPTSAPKSLDLATPTTGEHGNTIVEPEQLSVVQYGAELTVGETVEADYVRGCGFGGFMFSPTERFLASNEQLPTRPLVRDDFPADWVVYVFNDGAHDGPMYAILDVTITRLDDETIEMVEQTSGDLVDRFIRDNTDPEEWESC